MTPQDTQCIHELLEAACISGAFAETALRYICEEMVHLTTAEVTHTCRGHAADLNLNAAVSTAPHFAH